MFDELQQDLRYAWRTLVKSPAFTAVAVGTLALGIGAVTVIYSVVYNVAIAPLPYRDAGRLVNVFVVDTQTGRTRTTFPVPEFLDLSEGSRVFEDVVGTLGQGMRLDRRDRVEFLRAVWVTPNFFAFMGLEPLLGRTIGAADGRPGAPPVAVLRHRAWVTHFGADPAVIGSTIVLNGEARTVVGIMPARFTWHGADMWIPGPLERGAPGANATVRNFQARLRSGVGTQEAEAQLTALAQARAREYPDQYPGRFRVQVVNVIEFTVGSFRSVLYTVLGAVMLLLLIACCNVANMLLARATAREREMMIRAALGAGRTRIMRQLMVESALLAVGGAAGGCLLAYAGVEALTARLPQGPLPGEVDITLNAPVLAVSLAVAALSALLFGMTPAVFTARRDLVEGLKRSGKALASGRGRLRSALVIAEIALSIVLVLGAGLLTRSFVALMRVDVGFAPDNLLAVAVAFPAGGYATPAERQRFFQESLGRIRSLPGVRSAAATTSLPPFDGGASSALEIPGVPRAGGLTASVQLSTADYFRTIGVSVTSGELYADLGVDEAPTRVVVNHRFVQQYFGGQNPIGRQIRVAPLTGSPDPMRHGTFEIVGTVADVRNRGLREPIEPHVFLPWSGAARAVPLMLVSTDGDPARLQRAIRRELAIVDRQVAVAQARALREILDNSFYAQPRFSLLVLGLFAAAGTLLVAVGVFSVMAYTVSRQKKEIAVRMALGASRGHVFRVVLRRGAQLLGAGIGVGLLVSIATNRLIATQLWNVSPHDVLTFSAAILLVSGVALGACYVPALRAVRVDPVGALRDE